MGLVRNIQNHFRPSHKVTFTTQNATTKCDIVYGSAAGFSHIKEDFHWVLLPELVDAIPNNIGPLPSDLTPRDQPTDLIAQTTIAYTNNSIKIVQHRRTRMTWHQMAFNTEHWQIRIGAITNT